MIRWRTVSSALAIAVLSGCGVSYNVTIENRVGEPIRVELIDTWASGDEVWLAATVEADSTFDYSMRDGWRSEQKRARITRLTDGIEQGSPVEVRIVPGERLLPRSVHVVATMSADGQRLEAVPRSASD